MGVWTGGLQAIDASYITDVVQTKHKLRQFSELGIVALSGLVFGAVLGIIFDFAMFSIGPVKFDKFTWPGYSIFALIFIGTLL